MRTFVAALLLLLGCGDRSAPAEGTEAARNRSIGGGVAAQVGATSVPLSLVESVARAQHVSPKEALSRIVDDEISAAGARARGLDTTTPASWLVRAAEARFTADRVMDEARKAGPPTTEEVARLSELHWAEVDRPTARHVVHVIVLRATPRGKEIAEKLLVTTSGATSDADFEARAKSVPEAKFEKLDPFIADGRSILGPAQFDETFVRAAFALEKPGDMTGVVETGFGWHVIRLVEILPEKRMPIEARVIAFTEEANRIRSHALLDSRLRALRAAHPVTVAPAAAELMRSAMHSTSESALP